MISNNDSEKPNDPKLNGLEGNGEEITEELLGDSIPSQDKNRIKWYVILGAVAGIF